MITLSVGKARYFAGGLLERLVEGISVDAHVASVCDCVCVSLHTCRCVTKSEFVRERECSDDPCMRSRLNTLQPLGIEMG